MERPRQLLLAECRGRGLNCAPAPSLLLAQLRKLLPPAASPGTHRTLAWPPLPNGK
ncbi:MAG: hypothetical protein JWO29_1659 [Arthrobacter sp.]|jgi:hypothetical protein|nr:hypothetical protein [Arthrobacter sp.]